MRALRQNLEVAERDEDFGQENLGHDRVEDQGVTDSLVFAQGGGPARPLDFFDCEVKLGFRHGRSLFDRFDLEHPCERRCDNRSVLDHAHDPEPRRPDVDHVADLDLHGVGGLSHVCAIGEVQAVAEHRATVSAVSCRVPRAAGAAR